jgi:hypothetical protein
MEDVGKKLQRFLMELENSLGHTTERKDPLVLFVADEARGITKPNGIKDGFYYFRFVLRELVGVPSVDTKTSPLFFGVALDTFGEVARLMPKEDPDPSFRSFSEAERQLLPPMYLVQFRRNPVRKWWLAQGTEETQVLKSLLLNQGRYLWYMYRDYMNEMGLITFGCQKLLVGQNPANINSDEKQCVCMALLGCRVAIAFHCMEKRAFDMVRSYMGVCYFIFPGRDELVYGYPSEPLLAQSASLLLREGAFEPEGGDVLSQNDACLVDGTFSWKKTLKTVSPMFRKGLVGAGVRGELICRLLLTMAWDKCQKKEYLHRPVPILEFLKALGGNSLVSILKEKKNAFLNGRLYFTHFVYVDYEVNTPEMLASFARNGQAILCQNNQQAIDLLIPVVLDDDTPSFIAVQCKNRKKLSWTRAAEIYDASRMGFDKETFKAPYLVLCIQVGTVKTPNVSDLTLASTNDVSNGSQQTVIAMNGLSSDVFPILEDKELLAVFQEFQQSWNDPVALAEARKMNAYAGHLLSVMAPSYLQDLEE